MSLFEFGDAATELLELGFETVQRLRNLILLLLLLEDDIILLVKLLDEWLTRLDELDLADDLPLLLYVGAGDGHLALEFLDALVNELDLVVLVVYLLLGLGLLVLGVGDVGVEHLDLVEDDLALTLELLDLLEELAELLRDRGWQRRADLVTLGSGLRSRLELVEPLGEALTQVFDLCIQCIDFFIELCLRFVIGGVIGLFENLLGQLGDHCLQCHIDLLLLRAAPIASLVFLV